MAIPLSNEMKEVRAPRTAEIMPMDNQKMIEGMGQMALGMNRQMQEGFRGGLKLGQQIMDNQDAFKRNEAERKYNERTTELNTELAQKEGEERVKFQPKYEAEMKLASDTYEAAINKIHNFDIREGSKRAINAWNNRNASNYQYENYKNESNLQEKSMGQAMLSSTRKMYDAITPADNAKSVMALLNDPNMGMAHAEQMIRDFYSNRKGMPKEVVDQYVKDYKSKALTLAANRLAELTDQVNTNAAYDQSLNLINSGIDQGLINPEEGVQLKRTLEDQKLDMIAETNPGVLINADGTYNFNAAHRFAPDLTRKEIYKKLSTKSRKSGSGLGDGQALEQINDLAKDAWNEATLGLNMAGAYATNDYASDESNKAVMAQQAPFDYRREASNLVKLITFGKALTNGAIEIDENGYYTDPNTGVSVKTTGTGVKRILQKPTAKEINEKVNKAKARLRQLVSEKRIPDVYDPTIPEASKDWSAGEELIYKSLQTLSDRKGTAPVSAPVRIARKALSGLKIKKYDPTQTVNMGDMMSIIEGTQMAIGTLKNKYGFNDTLTGEKAKEQMERQVKLKNNIRDEKTGEFVEIPDVGPVTMETAANMELGYAILNRMDDNSFKEIYGQNAKKPENIAEMIQYGYEFDFSKKQGKKTWSNQLNKLFGYKTLEAAGNAFMPFYGTVNTALAQALEIKEPAPFGFTDAQAYQAVSKAGNVLKKGLMNVGTGNMSQEQYASASNYLGKEGIDMIAKTAKATKRSLPEQQPLDESVLFNKGLQAAGDKAFDYLDNLDLESPQGKAVYTAYNILNKMFSGKENNEPLTYDEFVSQEGAATADTYADYIGDRDRYMQTIGILQSTGATNADNPGRFFVTTSAEASSILSDMYLKSSGVAPSNPKYISEDIPVSDVLNAGVMSFTAPKRAFNEPAYVKDIPSDIPYYTPMFFFDRKSSTGYVVQGDNVNMLDCNFDEFVTLLGIAQGLVNQQPNVTTDVSGVPAEMVSNQFKPR